MNKIDNALIKIINVFFKFSKLGSDENRVTMILQFIKFGIVGVSNSFISYFINIIVLLLLKSFEFSWDYVVANMIAFFLSVLWAFYWNNRCVFILEEGGKRNLGVALVRTYIAYGFTGIILNNVLSYVWIVVLKISKYIAPLINIIISVPINFLMNKCWAFKS